jgi:hypothetical protein
MALKIRLNGLYSSASKLQDRAEVISRVRAYYWQRGLQQRGVEVASVRYVLIFSSTRPLH